MFQAFVNKRGIIRKSSHDSYPLNIYNNMSQLLECSELYTGHIPYTIYVLIGPIREDNIIIVLVLKAKDCMTTKICWDHTHT